MSTRTTSRIISSFIASVSFAALAGSAHAADLEIKLDNLRGTTGTAYIALYSTPESFPKNGQSIAGQYLPVTSATVSAKFLNLAPGRYAVSVFQDENGNGRLDTNPMGTPVEPYGFSNNASGSFGPPTFDAAAIDLTDDQSITIKLH